MDKARHTVTAILATALLILLGGGAAFAGGLCSKSQFVLDNRCMLFKKSGATTYTLRDIASPKIFSTQYSGPVLSFDVDELNDMPAGWIRETGVLDAKTGGRSEQFVGWIPVSDLVDSNSLRAVSDCWPIKSISYSAGDFSTRSTSLGPSSAFWISGPTLRMFLLMVHVQEDAKAGSVNQGVLATHVNQTQAEGAGSLFSIFM